MMKIKNYYFNYFFIALLITLIFTFILFIALFQLNSIESDDKIYEDNGVKIVKLNNHNNFNNHLERVNQYLRTYYRYSLNQLHELVDNEEKFELKSIKESNYFYVDENTPIIEKDTECTHYTCFDIYHCEIHNNLIKVYIYPIKNYVLKQNSKIEILNEFSEQYYQILESIIDSPFYTDKPEKACLFIPPIDTLNDLNYSNSTQISQILNHLKYFNENNGSNHLFFNFIPNEQTHTISLDSGKGLIASGGFDTFNFRQKFDISIPVYSLLSNEFQLNNHTLINHILFKNRKWTLLVTQFNLLTKDKQLILKKFELLDSKQNFLFLTNQCRNHNPNRYRCSLNKKLAFNYTQILQNSKFCLITRTKHLASTLLSDTLMYGCIPIILIDDYVLPFNDKIDWPRFSIKVNEKQLDNLLNIIKSIDDNTIYEMRKQAFLIWKTYFSSIDKITITTLFLLNERLFPHTSLPKENWNQLSLDLIDNSSDLDNLNENFFSNRKDQDKFINFINSSYDYEPLDLIKTKQTNLNFKSSAHQGFTAVILTYDRMDSLLNVIRQLINVPSCVKILIVWNNQNKKPPNSDEFFKLLNNNWSKQVKIPIQIVVTTENKLSNRFYPYYEIETDSILSIDDDITMLTADELEFTFQTWLEFSGLVGFPSRVHKWDSKLNRWRYESEWTNELSMILTGAAFYHKYYNFLYHFEMPKEIRDFVDSEMNCEDIALNFLIANITGKAPIKATPKKKFKSCPECANVPELSKNTISHLNKRSDCINIFTKIYGRMPLQTVEFRADPVLYKDNLPNQLKRFTDIGSL